MGCGNSAPKQTTDIVEQKKDVKLVTDPYADEDWSKIEVPLRVKLLLHEHELVKDPNKEDDTWACDGMHQYKTGCYSGITDFH